MQNFCRTLRNYVTFFVVRPPVKCRICQKQSEGKDVFVPILMRIYLLSTCWVFNTDPHWSSKQHAWFWFGGLWRCSSFWVFEPSRTFNNPEILMWFNRKSYRPQNSSVFPHLCSSAKATSPSYSRRGTIWKSCSDPVQHDRHWRYYPPNHPTILKIIWKKKTKIAVKGINVTLDFVRKQLFLLSQIRHRFFFFCVKQSKSLK